MGPQTAYAFRVYAYRHTGGPSPFLPDRDSTPPNPEPATAPPLWPRQAQVDAVFGGMGVHQVRLHLPFPMQLSWDRTKPVTSFFVHEKVHDSARRCFERIADAYDAAARRETGIAIFGGCLNVRRMRGGSAWSMHSWGIAIDFDPERNGLNSNRANARLARADCLTFWKIWEDEGWVSLGRTRDFDWMHVQAARL
ncbi:MAG: M15 family metallopeptidase [Bryobacterales bacterium]|nr:M15 family metallopeptidase [Bryobacterales bacterium]